MPSSPATTTMPSFAATESLLSCRFNFVKFVLDISSYVGINPGGTGDISWILAEQCTLNVIERCQGCYGGNNASSTASSSTEIDSNSGFFQTCLPATNATTGDPAGYVFVMMDSGGNGLCDNGICGGYSIVYDGEVFRFGGNFTETQEATFGGGGAGCDEGEGNDIVVAPLPTNSPTSRTTPSPTNSPTQRATTISSSSPSQFPSQSSSGSSQFPSQSPQQCEFPEQTQEQCAQEVTIEYRLTEPRSLGGDFTNRQFGSTVTFVGSNGNIVAAGGGDAVGDSRVHIYHKPSGSDWIYLTSLDPGLDELSTAISTLSLASSQEGYIVIGVPLSIEDELNSSKVYVYAPNESMTEWTQVAILLPDIISSVSNFPAFGSKVAIENNTIIVSSVGENYGRGAVYVFERLDGSDVWDQVAKFSADDLTDGASFGASISLQGGTLVVGGDFVGVGGMVYVFQKGEESWQLEASLAPVDVFSGEEFGASVAVSGCTMAVSSPKDESGSGSGTGTVRIFEYYSPSNSWFQVQALEAEDALTGDVFGDCIALEGNTLLVGSLSGGNSTGVVHQFEKNGSGQLIFDVRFTKTREISNPDPDSGDSFGCDIALSGNMAIVGAKMDSSLAQFSGSAYLFDLCPSAIFT